MTQITAWNDAGSWDDMLSWLNMVELVVPDHLRAGPALLARLREECSLVHDDAIQCVASLHLVAALISVTPAIFVVPWVEDVPEPAADDRYGVAGITDQYWLVLVIARAIERMEHGTHALREAGMIQTQVLDALKGFLPDYSYYPVRRRRAPDLGQLGASIDYEKGMAALPLMFSIQIAHQGSINAASSS
jgi:hypothetical protein